MKKRQLRRKQLQQPKKRRLHIGGKEKRVGWEVLDAVPGPHVDHLGDARDLSQFADNTFSEIYASHVVEHFDYIKELDLTLREWFRVLKPKGKIFVSAPDLDNLSKMFLIEDLSFDERFHVMRMMFGGHVDKYDYHVSGLNFEFLSFFLKHAGFVNIRRVEKFDVFDDCSNLVFHSIPVSVNVIAEKPLAKP